MGLKLRADSWLVDTVNPLIKAPVVYLILRIRKGVYYRAAFVNYFDKKRWIWRRGNLYSFSTKLHIFHDGGPYHTETSPLKLTFLTPWYVHVRVRIRGLEMLVSMNWFLYDMNSVMKKLKQKHFRRTLQASKKGL